MSNSIAAFPAMLSRPKITLMMLLCGAVGLAAGNAANADAAGDDAPRLVVRYDMDSLSTDAGAEALYRRLKRASVEVCPYNSGGHPFVPNVIKECREQAVARAVHQINSPRLAALYAGSAKSG